MAIIDIIRSCIGPFRASREHAHTHHGGDSAHSSRALQPPNSYSGAQANSRSFTSNQLYSEGSVIGITHTIYEGPLNSKSARFRAIVIRDGQEVPCTLDYQELTKREKGVEALAQFGPSW